MILQHRGLGFLIVPGVPLDGVKHPNPQPASGEVRFALPNLSGILNLIFLHNVINPLAVFLRKIPIESVSN